MTKLFNLFGRRLLTLGGAKASTMGAFIGVPEEDGGLQY
jgi:hypothetical protein